MAKHSCILAILRILLGYKIVLAVNPHPQSEQQELSRLKYIRVHTTDLHYAINKKTELYSQFKCSSMFIPYSNVLN